MVDVYILQLPVGSWPFRNLLAFYVTYLICDTFKVLWLNFHVATVLSKSPEAAVKIPYGKKYTISFYDIFSIKIPYLIDLKPENVQFLVRNVFF